MDIQDLDFKELLQKPAEKLVSTCYLEGQLSNQELETVVGGVRAAVTDAGHDGHPTICVPDLNNPPDYIMCVNFPDGVTRPLKALLGRNLSSFTRKR